MSETTDEQVRVTTYVPRWQKERWAEHADALDMSQSEFLRSMVQAGRRGFEVGSGGDERGNPPEGDVPDATPGVNGLEDRVVGVLRDESYLDWEELVARVSDDFEDRLDDALESLQQSNRIAYSGRHGGYTLVEDGD